MYKYTVYIIIFIYIIYKLIEYNSNSNSSNSNSNSDSNSDSILISDSKFEDKFINYIDYSNKYLDNYNNIYIDAPFSIMKKININDNHVNSVPLNIYITWENRKLPYNMYKNLMMLSLLNPEFNIYLYNPEDRLKFIQEYFDKDVVDAYNSLIPGSFKADVFKYGVIYKLGGVYMDIKYITHYSLIKLINDNPVQFAEQRTDVCNDPTIIDAIMSGFFISPPNNKIFLYTINEIVLKCKNKDYGRYVTDITGPCVLTRNINKIRNEDKSNDVATMSWDATDTNDFFYIKNTDILILSRYKEYRTDQFNFFKNNKMVDYREAWKNRTVFV